MKSILILSMITASLFAQEFPIKKVGTIKATWSEPNNDVNAYLIGQTSYGTNKASHFEIVNKKIIRKDK